MGRLVEFQNVKNSSYGEVEICAVDGVDFGINEGANLWLLSDQVVPKTTVLNILGEWTRLQADTLSLTVLDISSFNSRQLTSCCRRDDIGLVFQFYNLVQNLTALENVELALQICKDPLWMRSFNGCRITRQNVEFPCTVILEGNSSVLLLQGHWQRIRNFFCVMNRQEH